MKIKRYKSALSFMISEALDRIKKEEKEKKIILDSLHEASGGKKIIITNF